MRIEQLMAKSPKSCQPRRTLSEAAQMMCDHDCKCLSITAGDGSQRVVGMITDPSRIPRGRLRNALNHLTAS